MKQTLTLLFVAVLAISTISCKKNDTSYAGTYTGSITSAGQSKSNIKLTFIEGLTDDALTLYGYPLTKTSDGVYTATGTMLVTIIQLINSSITLDQIENAKATFTFSDNSVNMKLTYNVAGIADLTVVTYDGTK